MTSEPDFVLIRPEEAVAFEGNEFDFAFAYAFTAGQLQRPVESPRKFGVNIRGDRGEVTRYTFTDRAENRAMLALKEHFGSDRARFQSAAHRFWAVTDLLRSGKLGKWVRRSRTDDGSMEFHPAIIRVAGRRPLSKRGTFALKPFLKELEKSAREEFPDEELPESRP